MSETISKKIALITGATAGIGEACAHKFAMHGYNVIINGRRSDRLQKLEDVLKEEYGNEVLALPFDVRDRAFVNESLSSIPRSWKDIDVLINNAGLASGLSTIQDGDMEDWDAMIDTNVKGLLNVSRAVMPHMVERKGGHIINVSSIAGKDVYLKGNIYCATKHAVDAITKAMRIDMLSHGVRVSSVSPGAAETEFSLVRFKGDASRASQTYSGYQPLSAEDVAETIWFIASRPAHVTIGDIIITPTAQANAFYVHKESQS